MTRGVKNLSRFARLPLSTIRHCVATIGYARARMRLALRSAAFWALAALVPFAARGDTQPDRFDAGGYLRIGTRPDFQGGSSTLGYWNLYGRLLNEGPYAALEMKLNLLQPQVNSDHPWTSIHMKVEGGSIQGADANGGSLTQYRVSQLYVQAGNVLLKDVTWQLGTLDAYYGTLGLYDMRLAELFYETIGLSARYQAKNIDLLVGIGDSGWYLRGAQYSPILTLGASLRAQFFNNHMEVGLGGQLFYEPQATGNRYSPYNTPINVNYADFVRHEVVLNELLQHPEETDNFPKPVPTSSSSYKMIGYIGFGNLGPLKWNSLYANFSRLHPQQSYTETYSGTTYTIYDQALTNQRYQFNAGNEAVITLIPNRLDAVWSMLYGYYIDKENKVAVSDNNREFFSTVVRLQAYITDTVHFLTETSVAREHSLNGNAYRDHADSVYTSTNGRSDPRGLQYGDSSIRDTWQFKAGPVLNPTGMGVFTRPSIRLLYGVQYSTMNNAYGNSFVDNLDQNNVFKSVERHWHHVVALEAEAWF
jgi:hypothetical protein